MKHLDPAYVERVHAFDRVYQARRENVNDDGNNTEYITREQSIEQRQCAYERCCNSNNDKQRLKRCGRCKAVYYCSVMCQRSDWKAGHRNACRTPLQRQPSQANTSQDELPPGSVVFHDKACMIELITDDGSRIRIRAQDSESYTRMVQKTTNTFASASLLSSDKTT